MNARTLVVSCLCVIFALAAIACGKKDEAPAGKSYTVRGSIDSIPADGKTLYIKHEAIPGFVNAMGKSSTMESMVMGFAVDAVSIEGLAVGDILELQFHTDWKAKPALRLDKITKLPADTALEF